jgi:hypothetical protein
MRAIGCTFGVLLLVAPWAFGQQEAMIDAPIPQVNQQPRNLPEASPYARYIRVGQRAPELTSENKVVMGFRDAVTPFSVLGWASIAEYEQVRNVTPNYGTNGGAYLQRFGAAAARGASKGVFTASLFAPLLHEDPRYYKVGRSRSAAYRLFYAGSRVFITKRDDGSETVNWALLSGDLAGTALTQAYYPAQNRGAGIVGRDYGVALGGSAVTFALAEYLAETLEFLHVPPALVRQR